MLEDYRLHQVLTRRYHASKNPLVLEGKFSGIYEDYCSYLRRTDLAVSTVKHYSSTALVFLDYLSQKGIEDPMAIDLSVCNGYLKTLAGFSFKTVEQNVCGLRFLLRYLLERKILTEDFASKIHMYRFAKAIDAKSRDPRIPLLLPAQLVRDDKQRDREDQPVEEAAPENKPLILHFSFPPFQHFQHVLPKTDDYIRITYTKFALESHRYFSCSKTSHRTEAPRFPLFRIAENPLTNYPRGGIYYIIWKRLR